MKTNNLYILESYSQFRAQTFFSIIQPRAFLSFIDYTQRIKLKRVKDPSRH